MSKTAVSVKKFIRLDGSSLKSLLRPPRPIGSTKLRVPTPLMHISIDNIIAKYPILWFCIFKIWWTYIQYQRLYHLDQWFLVLEYCQQWNQCKQQWFREKIELYFWWIWLIQDQIQKNYHPLNSFPVLSRMHMMVLGLNVSLLENHLFALKG